VVRCAAPAEQVEKTLLARKLEAYSGAHVC
jgi:hypothetical protein